MTVNQEAAGSNPALAASEDTKTPDHLYYQEEVNKVSLLDVDDSLAVDLSKVAASLLLEQHIESLQQIIDGGCEIKKVFSDQSKEILNSEENQKFERLNLQMAVSKMSDDSIEKMKENLAIIKAFLVDDTESLMETQEVVLTELFIVLLKMLKPRSKRHLQTFLQAWIDGEWIDALIIGHGSDTELRTIDRCSDSARSEFGLSPISKN